VASGSDELTVTAALRAVLNTGSVVVLVTGLAILTFGVLPRLTVAIPVAVTVGGYVLTLLGPALSWPSWIIDLSPFTHLAICARATLRDHLSRRHGPDRLHGGRMRSGIVRPAGPHRRLTLMGAAARGGTHRGVSGADVTAAPSTLSGSPGRPDLR